MNYSELTKKEKETLIRVEYVQKKKSFPEIAEQVNTYPNKLRRDAKNMKIAIRSKSEAQKNALHSGRTIHPTEGKERDEVTKIKISEKRAEAWSEVSTSERKKVSERVQKQWQAMSVEDRKKFRQKATTAILDASKTGSKLEKYLFEALVNDGYYVEFHKEHLLAKNRLHIDLFLPTINVAIEVDGPSHFLPIWGQKTLTRNQKADAAKNGLLIGKGLKVVRIKQLKQLTEKYKRDTKNNLLVVLEQITNKSTEEKYFEI